LFFVFIIIIFKMKKKKITFKKKKSQGVQRVRERGVVSSSGPKAQA
jgi:hypothetical protein